nr:hypothetical protein [Tanacetum cinerariifolium]
MHHEQYTLDRKAKMERLDCETLARVELINSQKRSEDLKVLTINTSGMDPIEAEKGYVNTTLIDDEESSDDERYHDANQFFNPYLSVTDEGYKGHRMKCNDNTSELENFVQNDAPHSGNINQQNEGICRVDKFEDSGSTNCTTNFHVGSATTWDDLVEKFDQKFYQHSDHNDEIKEDDNPEDNTDIFKIESNLFDFETPLCEAFNDFNYLLKIDKDLFTFDIQGTGTYEEYELNNHVIRDLEEPWLDNGVPYQLCDHICEPYRFKNRVTKWPTYSSDIDEFCNGRELPKMVWVGSMTYFQDHTCFGNFYELDYIVLVKLQECWWKINANEVASFTRLENYGQRPYANIKTERAHDPFLEVNNIFDRNYDTCNTQGNQGHKEHMDDPTLEPSVCKIRRFKMMKYSFNDDEEYIAIKESEYLNHSKNSLDAYRELLRIIDEE